MLRVFPQTLLRLSLLLIALVTLNGYEARAQTATPEAGEIVFSQIYTGGGNPGSTYKNNFLELFNRSDHPIDIAGQLFHVASDTGMFNVAFSFGSSRGLVIQPGGYLLIELATTGISGGPLPLPDLIVPQFPQFSINLSPSGKIALTKQGTTLFGPCLTNNPGIIDFVGYGSPANCFEGSGPTATLNDTTAAVRKSRGCTDTNNNTNDFVVSAPNPRNSFWPKNPCTGNAIDEPDFFTRQHYSDFLNRQPDPSGLVFWSNQIATCGVNQACIETRRINDSGAFFLSIEFQETAFLVYRTYKSAFGNISGTPVPLTLQEFLPDSQLISHGVVVNQSGWELLLESNKVAFFLDFISRLRFRNAFPNTLAPAQFVDALFQNAAVIPTAAERSAAIAEFGSASDTLDQTARARALRRVAENTILAAQEKNRAFVLFQYFGYLRRNPNDAPEPTLDFTGYNFWLNKLNEFNGNFVTAEMVKSFITSPEYRARF